MIRQITADELADRLETEDSFTLVDTRPEDSYESWHIPGAANFPFPPGGDLSDEQERRVDKLGNGDPVVAICGKGISSTSFAVELDDHGHDDVEVVKGGMEDWSTVVEAVPLRTDKDDLVVRQLQRRATGCLGYLVGSTATGEAIAVDVTRETDAAKVAAEEAGLTITRVVDTHLHADHLSGGPTLARELDVPYHLSGHLDGRDRTVDIGRRRQSLTDGDVLSVGTTGVAVRHTPGHTSEMLALVVDDEAVLTGDTLFVDGVGRTELQFGDADAERGASMLHRSANQALGDLPDHITVLPGHVAVDNAGDFETAEPGEPIAARLGDLRGRLDVFTHDRESFVEELAARDPEKPRNYETIVDVNAGIESIDSGTEATELELGPNNCSA